MRSSDCWDVLSSSVVLYLLARIVTSKTLLQCADTVLCVMFNCLIVKAMAVLLLFSVSLLPAALRNLNSHLVSMELIKYVVLYCASVCTCYLVKLSKSQLQAVYRPIQIWQQSAKLLCAMTLFKLTNTKKKYLGDKVV